MYYRCDVCKEDGEKLQSVDPYSKKKFLALT